MMQIGHTVEFQLKINVYVSITDATANVDYISSIIEKIKTL